jgi:hypothetical protein
MVNLDRSYKSSLLCIRQLTEIYISHGAPYQWPVGGRFFLDATDSRSCFAPKPLSNDEKISKCRLCICISRYRRLLQRDNRMELTRRAFLEETIRTMNSVLQRGQAIG